MTSVKFSVCLPNTKEGKAQPLGSVDASWLKIAATEAERIGYDGVWLGELLQAQGGAGKGGEVDVSANAEPANYYDAIATMGYVVAITQQVRITTATIVLPHHHPILLSRQITTLDVLSNGRVTLGVGLGGSAASFRQLRGEYQNPNRGEMMDEYLSALRLLLQEPSASYAGRYTRFTNAEAYPKPVQEPLPIYVAGEGDGPFGRVARYGQGWIDSHHVPSEIESIANRFRARRPGPDPVAIARQFYIALAPTREAARRYMSDGLGGVEAQQVVADPQERRLVGTPDDLVERLIGYGPAGVDEICAIFYGASATDMVAQMELFMSEVAPRIR